MTTSAASKGLRCDLDLTAAGAGAAIMAVEAVPEHGRVLTDDFNPVEFYDASNREALRRQLALGAREW